MRTKGLNRHKLQNSITKFVIERNSYMNIDFNFFFYHCDYYYLFLRKQIKKKKKVIS